MRSGNGRSVRVWSAVLVAAGAIVAPVGSSAVEDEPVRGSVLDRQRDAYESFQRRQKQNYEAFQEDRKADYEAYMENVRASYERFTGIVEEVEAEEEDRLAERWEEPELSSKTVWVEYSEDASERRKVDFERGLITIEAVGGAGALDDPEALRRRIRALVTETRAQAFERDRVAQAIERRSRREIDELETAEVSETSVLWPYMTGRHEVAPGEVDVVVELLVAKAEARSLEVRGETMQQVTIPLDVKTLLAQLDKLQSGGFAAQMPDVAPQAIPRPTTPAPQSEGVPPGTTPQTRPESSPSPQGAQPMPELPRTGPLAPRQPDARPRPTPAPTPAPRATRPRPRPSRPAPAPAAGSLPPRARAYLGSVQEHGEPRRLDRALMFAIIETESAFNPLARSGVPAYGLMQIVPRSAGQDASAVLFGRPRILAPSYLYDAEKNIQIGAIYLDILLSRYLKGIEDPRSRLYCAIAAYNTGAGNVFRTFTGRTKPKAAFAEINRMSPDDVYRKLIWRLPYKETRQYLAKVVERMDKYR